jgi:Sec-independent protein secretion pathway component TatC
MIRNLTLFLVCAFEIPVVLFVLAWTAWADSNRLNGKNLLALLPIYEVLSLLGSR